MIINITIYNVFQKRSNFKRRRILKFAFLLFGRLLEISYIRST
jgi:hypothetical protein